MHERAKGRFDELDGLRALAAAGIVAYQTFRFAGPRGVPAPLAHLATDGSQGLALFFLVSGFALAHPLLAALRAGDEARIDVGRYAASRLLRIYPAYLAAVALAVALHPLAVLFAYPALAHAAPAFALSDFARFALFDGRGLDNDGFGAVALFARAYLLFPLLFALWVRAPRAAIAAVLLAAFLDAFTAIHGWGIGAVVPFVLGIAAADLRVRRRRHEQRYGLIVAPVALAVALACEGRIASLHGALVAPGSLRIDPFWSIAFFGVLIAAGTVPNLRRALGFAPLRAAGAVSYAASLVAMPVAAFAARRLPITLGHGAIAGITAAACAVAGIALWHGVDRPFGRVATRTTAASRPGGWIDRILGVRYATIVFEPPARRSGDVRAPSGAALRPAGELAVVASRTGTPEQMAAEIAALKRRLRDPGAFTFAEVEAKSKPAKAAPPLEPTAGAPTIAHLWSAGRSGMRLPSSASIRVTPALRVVTKDEE